MIVATTPVGRVEVVEGDWLGATPVNPPESRIALRGTQGLLSLSTEELSRHVFFLGSIGSGKTNAMFLLVAEIRRIMGPQDVMIVFDTKGDYFSRFGAVDDSVIASTPLPSATLVVWNVFAELTAISAEEVQEAAFEMAQTLFDQRIARSYQPFFPRAAADVFASVLVALQRRRERPTNADLRALFDRSTMAEIRSLLEEHDDLRGACQYIADDRTAQTAGVMSEVQQLVRETFLGTFREPGAFSIQEFLRTAAGQAVFVEFDIKRGNTLSSIYRVLLDLAFKESLSRREEPRNVYVVLDEFTLLPNLSYIDTALNFGRELGLKFVVGAQNVGQIHQAYGAGRAASILSGFGTVVAFRLFDRPSRQFVIDRHGLNRKRLITRATTGNRPAGETIVEGRVIEDWQLSSLDVGESIVSRSTGPPFLFGFDRFEG